MIFIIGTIARSTTCFVIAGKNTGQGPGLLGLYEVGTAALRGWSGVLGVGRSDHLLVSG
jgi:hypothetical protein